MHWYCRLRHGRKGKAWIRYAVYATMHFTSYSYPIQKGNFYFSWNFLFIGTWRNQFKEGQKVEQISEKEAEEVRGACTIFVLFKNRSNALCSLLPWKWFDFASCFEGGDGERSSVEEKLWDIKVC